MIWMKIKNKSFSKCIVSISGKKCAVLGFVFNVHVLISSSFVCFRIYFLYPFSVEHLESESHTNNLVARLCSFTRIYVSVSLRWMCLCTLITFEPFTLNWISRKLNRPAYRCYYHIQPAKFRRQVNDKHLRRNKLKTANKLHLKPLIESIAHLLLLH